MLGRHALKGWSKTQTLIALSSGESELYAALKPSAEALGIGGIVEGPWLQCERRDMGRRERCTRDHKMEGTW